MNRVVLSAVVLASLSLARPATAEETVSNQTKRLPDVVVTSTRLPDEKVSIETFPANVTVLTRDQIAASPAASLPDLLRQQTGLTALDTVGFGQFGNISLRGYGERTGALILVDGMRVNDAGDSTVPYLWNTVPMDNIERIEIIRGGSSTTYGEGAIGGVINIITRKPVDKPIGGTFTASGGNLGYYTGNLNLSGHVKEFDYIASGDRREWDGWRESSAYRAWSAHVKPSLDTAAGKFTLGYFFHDETVENPGVLTEKQFEDDPRQAGINTFVFENTIHRAMLDYAKNFDSGWSVLGKVHGQTFDTESFSNFGTGTIEQPNFGTTWQVTYCSDVARRSNMLTMGVEAIQQDFQSTFNSFGSEFITGADNWTVSAFVQDTYQITETLALIGGIRFDHREWDVVSLSPFSPAVDEDRHADVWSPKLGATWEMIENTTAWLTLSRSYRLPTGFDIGAAGSGGNALFFANPTIDPVDARTIEIGTRCHRSVMLSGSVAWFYSDVRDDILFNPFNFQNENFDSTRQGVELTLNSKPVKWVNLYATAAYVDTEFDGGAFDGNQLPLVAEWQFTGGITLEPITGLFLTLEAIHARDQIRNNDLRNDFDSNDYTVVNARASYRWKFMTMFVNVNNLLDKLYETFPTVSTGPGGAQAAAYNPAAGINFQAGASFTF